MAELIPEKHLDPFKMIGSIENEFGYIVWRVGTGGNVELLHISASKIRQGYGTQLVKQMVFALNENPPYHTVFGFTRTVNNTAIQFYESLGFRLTLVEGVYRDGHAILFSQPYEDLLKRFQEV